MARKQNPTWEDIATVVCKESFKQAVGAHLLPCPLLVGNVRHMLRHAALPPAERTRALPGLAAEVQKLMDATTSDNLRGLRGMRQSHGASAFLFPDQGDALDTMNEDGMNEEYYCASFGDHLT